MRASRGRLEDTLCPVTISSFVDRELNPDSLSMVLQNTGMFTALAIMGPIVAVSKLLIRNRFERVIVGEYQGTGNLKSKSFKCQHCDIAEMFSFDSVTNPLLMF